MKIEPLSINENEKEKDKFSTDLDLNESNSGSLKGSFTLALFYCTSISVIGGTFIVGWHIGLFNTPSQVLKQFFNDKNDGSLSETVFWSLANGLLQLGGALGGLCTGIVVEKIGHKNGMLVINLLGLISGVLFVISKPLGSYITLIIGRFLTGFISGYFCGICPLYLSEIAPQNLRGFFGTINAVAICVGNLAANFFGLPEILGSESLWPYLLGLMFIPCLIHIVGLPFCIESPKHLYITLSKPDAARKSLEKLRGSSNRKLINNEIELLRLEKEEISQRVQVSYIRLVKDSALRKALIVSIVLQASQQFSGIIAVTVYSTDIFISIGLEKKTWAIYAAILLSFVETVAHVGVMFVIDLKGRRFLLICGMIGMSVCCFVLGLTRILFDEDNWSKYLAVIAVIIYIIFFSLGPGPIPLLVTAELFNTETRGKATSIAVFFNWFFSFIVSFTFPYIQDGIGGYSFIIYGIFLICFAVFTYFKVPETKNKSIQEILTFFQKNIRI